MAGECSFGDAWMTCGPILEKIGIYAVGIAVFTLISLLFYKMLSKRSMFGKESGDEILSSPGRHWAHILLFPFVSFGFFLMLAAAFLFLTGTAGSSDTFIHDTKDILAVAMAVVLSVRVLAYLNREASEEVGKIMPLGLLGVFLLVNPSDSVFESVKRMGDLYREWQATLVVFAAIVFAEYVLFAIAAIVRAGQKPKHKAAPAPPMRTSPASPARPPQGQTTFIPQVRRK
jgi:hypothetical protein